MSAVHLAFEEYGDLSQPPLIILHGFFASSRNWRQIAKKLAEHCHVYVLDVRNHGLSPHHPEMDYPSMIEDLDLFIQEHQITTVNLLGHSMGGKIAMWFALNYPDKIDKLMVADISPVSYPHNFDHTIESLQAIPLDQISNRKQANDFLSLAIPEWSYRQFLLQNLQLKNGQYSWRIDLDIFYQTGNNIAAFPAVESLPPLLNKVLFIMGGHSTYLDKKAIDQCFPKAEITLIAEASHWLHVDNPKDFCAEVVKFL